MKRAGIRRARERVRAYEKDLYFPITISTTRTIMSRRSDTGLSRCDAAVLLIRWKNDRLLLLLLVVVVISCRHFWLVCHVIHVYSGLGWRWCSHVETAAVVLTVRRRRPACNLYRVHKALNVIV